MKLFDWNNEKSEWLTRVRGISFEEIVFHIQAGDLIDVVTHQNPEKYPGQRILVVEVENYAYLVPFVETANAYFLKTIIPSRKFTKRYLKGRNK